MAHLIVPATDLGCGRILRNKTWNLKKVLTKLNFALFFSIRRTCHAELTNKRNWIQCLACNKVNLLTPACGEGKIQHLFVEQGEWELMLKDLNSPMAFRKGLLKTVWGKGSQMHDQLVHSSLIVDEEVRGWCFRNLNQPSGSSLPEVSVSVASNFLLVGVWFL